MTVTTLGTVKILQIEKKVVMNNRSMWTAQYGLIDYTNLLFPLHSSN